MESQTPTDSDLASLAFPGTLVRAIHPQDEMYAFIAATGIPPERARFEYLRSGREAWLVVDHALRSLGRRWADLGRVLEFACGYGRFTRFLVQDCPADRVWSSDVMPNAVQHVVARYRVHGLVSAFDPGAVELGDGYDLIWVGSLFSHLPRPRFEAWLARLAAALSDRGLLMLTTHRLDQRPAHLPHEDGFAFAAESANARLAGSEYGTAYVTPSIVRDLAVRLSAGRHACAERGIWNVQDVHAIAPSARGRITLAECAQGGFARLGGFACIPRGHGEVAQVEVTIDGRHDATARLHSTEGGPDAARWQYRLWLLEGDLGRYGRGEHRLVVRAAAHGEPLEVIDAVTLVVP